MFGEDIVEVEMKKIGESASDNEGVSVQGSNANPQQELYERCARFLVNLNSRQFDLHIRKTTSERLASDFDFIHELRGIERELEGIGRILYNSLPEDEHLDAERNQAMDLWARVIVSATLDKV